MIDHHRINDSERECSMEGSILDQYFIMYIVVVYVREERLTIERCHPQYIYYSRMGCGVVDG
jgi:hypothetical protein